MSLDASGRFSDEFRIHAERIAALRNELEHASDEVRRVANPALEELERAHQQVETERQRYQNLFEFAPDAYLLTTPDGIILEATRAASTLFGVQPERIIGKPLANFVAQDARSAFRTGLGWLRETGSTRDWEVQFEPRNGTPFPAEITASVVPEAQGNPAAIRWLIRDIRERKQEEERARHLLAEQAARRAAEASEEHFRLLVEGARDYAMFLLDAEGRIASWNTGAERIFGYTEEEVIGQPGAIIFTPEERANHAPETEAETAQREGHAADVRWHVRKDGTWFWADGVLTALHKPDGTLRGYAKVLSDRTEAKRRQDAQEFLLQATGTLGSSLDYEATLRSVADLAVPSLADWCVVDMLQQDGSIRRLAVAHRDATKVELARALARMYPLNPAAATGIPRVLRTGEPEFVPNVDQAALGLLADDPDHLDMIRRLGLCSYIVAPLAARGRTLGAISFASAESSRSYDEQDLALAEELARRAALAVDNARLYAEAQAAIRARDEVLAVVSHDLRNPVHATVMAASTLLMTTPEDQRPANFESAVEIIRTSAGQMEHLIEDLLDINRFESGNAVLSHAAEDVQSLVDEACSAFRHLAEGKRIVLTCTVAGKCPPVRVDRNRLLQVLSNLVGNALKFTSSGGKISIRVEPMDKQVRFTVADTGVGIAPEHLPHLFDRFWQANRAGRQGSGLGLAIAKQIVEAHGGRILVESNQGQGTTFFFTVPAA